MEYGHLGVPEEALNPFTPPSYLPAVYLQSTRLFKLSNSHHLSELLSYPILRPFRVVTHTLANADLHHAIAMHSDSKQIRLKILIL